MTKFKSLFVLVLTLFVASFGQFGQLFSEHAQAWLGITAFAVGLILSVPGVASGTTAPHWTFLVWLTYISGLVIQVLNIIGAQALINPVTVTYIVAGIQLFVQTFIKNYGNGSLLESGTTG